MFKRTKGLIAVILSCATMFCSVNAFALDLTFSVKKNSPNLKIPIDESIVVKKGILVFEAEKMNYQNCAVLYPDEKASGGLALNMNTTQWEIERTIADDIWSDVYVADKEDAGNYRIWFRSRATNDESGSMWVNPNTGVYAATYYTKILDGEYRWAYTNVTLHEGLNRIAFRSRTTGIFDKFILSNDFGFTPVGKDDEPVYMTEEEKETLWRTYWAEPKLKPIEGHPRLLVTKDFIPTLKANLETEELVNIKKRFIGPNGYADQELNCKLDTTKRNNHNSMLCTKIMARALKWVLGEETDPAYAQKTFGYMKDYLDTVRTPDDQGDITRSRGNILYTAAIVYDWMYDQWSREQKDYLIDKMITVILSKEIGWPPIEDSDLANHSGEQEIWRDLLGAGIAMYDEYPLVYDLAAGRMFDKFIPARKFLRNSGRFEIGHDYSLCRTYSELWADMTMQRMGYPSIFDGALYKAFQWRIDARMPYGLMIPDGDMYSVANTKDSSSYYCDYVLAPYLAANLYKDPYLMYECKRNQVTNSYGEYENFFVMLFTDPTVTSKTFDDKPLAKHSEYPLSSIIAKTSWQEGLNSDAAMAYLDMHEIWIGDHQHVYTGQFQMYYKGLLAMDTGTYNYSNAHNEGYSHRAISANTMLVYDPDETFRAGWGGYPVQNDGGQRFPYDGDETVKHTEELQIDENGISQNKMIEVANNTKYYIGPNKETPEISYITGNVAPAYTDKVQKYNRSMAFLDLNNDKYPAALIVYDKLEKKKADFRSVFLLHSQEKPEVSGNTTVIERKEFGFGGRLVNKTMYPAPSNCKIGVVGGMLNEMFTINGYNYGSTSDAIECGRYRIEVESKNPTKSEKYLNAMFVTDAGNTEELPMTKVEQSGFIGVNVMDKTVLFSKDAEVVDSKIDLSLMDSGYSQMTIMLGGVKPGVWTVTGNGTSTNIKVSEDSEALIFKGAPGRYEITPAAEGSVGIEITGEKMQKRLIGDFGIWNKDPEDSASNKGNYIFLEKPTKIIDGEPYIAVDVLAELDSRATVNGKSADIDASSGVLTVTADSTTAYISGNAVTLAHPPKYLNDTVYVNPSDIADYIGYTFDFKGELTRVLVAKKFME